MLEWTIIALFIIAIVLLIFSFFKQDKVSELEKQVEQLQMTMIKENYQLKKKMKVFEEEFILNEQPLPSYSSPPKPSTTVKKRADMTEHEEIIYLYESGLDYEQISIETGLPYDQIKLIVERVGKGGRRI